MFLGRFALLVEVVCVVAADENGKFGAPVASVLVSLLAEELLPWYISGVGGVVLMYHPHSGDTYPFERAGLPPPVVLGKDGMVMPAPPILGM